MISQRLFRWMHKVALVAMIFASLAPSISHALASQNNAKGFLQEICSASGQRLFIQVVTTQGQQLQMALDVKPDQQPTSISHHLEHCPFCHAGIADVMLPAPNAEMIVRSGGTVQYAHCFFHQLHFSA